MCIRRRLRIRALLNGAGVNIITPIYPQPATDNWSAAAANEINSHMANDTSSVMTTQPSTTNYTITYVGNEGNIADCFTIGQLLIMRPY